MIFTFSLREVWLLATDMQKSSRSVASKARMEINGRTRPIAVLYPQSLDTVRKTSVGLLLQGGSKSKLLYCGIYFKATVLTLNIL